MMPVSASAVPHDDRRSLLGAGIDQGDSKRCAAQPPVRPRVCPLARGVATTRRQRVRFVALRDVHRRERRRARALVPGIPRGTVGHFWHSGTRVAQWDTRGTVGIPCDAVLRKAAAAPGGVTLPQQPGRRLTSARTQAASSHPPTAASAPAHLRQRRERRPRRHRARRLLVGRLRRADERDARVAERLLRSFTRFAGARGETYVGAQMAIDWAGLGSP